MDGFAAMVLQEGDRLRRLLKTSKHSLGIVVWTLGHTEATLMGYTRPVTHRNSSRGRMLYIYNNLKI